jgi:hypothetical protein
MNKKKLFMLKFTFATHKGVSRYWKGIVERNSVTRDFSGVKLLRGGLIRPKLTTNRLG